MENRFHTIILVPHARARLRKWRVSSLQITLAASLLVLATLGAAFFTWGYFTRTVDGAELQRLRSENEELRQVNQSFEASVRQLQDKLTDYEDRTLELAIVAGLDPPEGSEAGIGGGLGNDGAAVDLDAFELRAQRLDGTLDQVESRLHEQLQWISSMPAITPARGILTSGFGMRRDPITSGRAFHAGLDIAAAPGAPVYAAADGVVARAGRNGGLGKAVFVSHGYGLSTRYGHLSKIAVEPGDRVKRGDVIGYVGNTGRSTGYHLHYEVHEDGKAVNPAAYLLDQPLGS
jgi:murein DD-endopeptidase MepM/ murein hydrolase activator NlpD